MEESLRPTNVLVDAANNTSLAPLDLGDGPAGTRAAGYNVTTLESFLAPRRLHSAPQVPPANSARQSAHPSAMKAAGRGRYAAQSLVTRGRAQVAADLARLRQTQKADGSWGFHPGVTTDNGKTWKNGSDDQKDNDPAPTALALSALAGLGFDDKDPSVRRGVD